MRINHLLNFLNSQQLVKYLLFALVFSGNALPVSAAKKMWLSFPPVISNFSPTKGPVGTVVTINGSNLGNATAAKVGTVAAVIVSKSANKLVLMVMPGSISGAISVTNPDGTGSGASNFEVGVNKTPGTLNATLTGTGNIGAASQGSSVVISADGNTALVGAPKDNADLGAVWVFIKKTGIWEQQFKLTPVASGKIAFGSAVALSADGNTALVGAPDDGKVGSTWVFIRNEAGVWSQQGNKLTGAGSIFFTSTFVKQGASVALSADGNTAVIGGPGDFETTSSIGARGSVWVFLRNAAGVWTQSGSRFGGTSGTAANQGTAVALSADGKTILVGGPSDESQVGAAWIFRRQTNDTWTQQIKLLGRPNGDSPRQGTSVALSADGNTAIVGGPENDYGFGGAWVSAWNGTGWVRENSLLTSTTKLGPGTNSNRERYGTSVSISADGNTAIVGAPSGIAGSVILFKRSASREWSQYAIFSYSPFDYQGFGTSVSLRADGLEMIGGRPYVSSNNGGAYVVGLSANTDLQALEVKKQSGELIVYSPAFSSGVVNYTAAVPDEINSIAFRPLSVSTVAITRVNGSVINRGNSTSLLPLDKGANVFTIEVTAENEINKKTYTVTVTREDPLPVSLISYTASANGNHALLRWATASEQNNAGFEIERSGDGIYFTKLENIAGQGNSSSRFDYSYTDRSPLNGTNYYRLKQTDRDGKLHDLGVKTVSFNLGSHLEVFPNPVLSNGKLSIRYSEGIKSIRLTDMSGKILLQPAMVLNTTFSEIDMSNFPPGIYLIHVETPYENFIRKVIKP